MDPTINFISLQLLSGFSTLLKNIVNPMKSKKPSRIIKLSPEAEHIHKKLLHSNSVGKLTARPFDLLNSCYQITSELVSKNRTNGASKNHTNGINIVLEIIWLYSSSIKITPAYLKMVESLITVETERTLELLALAINRSSKEELSDVKEILHRHSSLKGVKHFLETKLPETAVKPSLNLLVSAEDILNGQIHDTKLILEYLKGSELVGDELLSKIVALLSEDSKHLTEILNYIFIHNKKLCTVLRSANQPLKSLQITPHLVSIVTSAVLSGSDQSADELVGNISSLLIPSFISLIRKLNEQFIDNNRFVSTLRNIIGYIGYAVFSEIITINDITKYYTILKSISNADLSHYISLYNEFASNTDCESVLVSLLPCFSNYSTDNNRVIHIFMNILQNLLTKYPGKVSSALEHLIRTHHLNLSERLVLANPIDSNSSTRILSYISNSNIGNELVSCLNARPGNEFDGAILALINYCGFDISQQIYQIVLSPSSSSISLYTALHLFPLFASKFVLYNFELVSSLLQHSSSDEPKIKKKALLALESLIGQGIPECICELFFTSKMSVSSNSGNKNRISLLIGLLKMKCSSCKLENRYETILDEIFSSLFSTKIKKMVEDMLPELSANLAFREYLVKRIDLNSGNVPLQSGLIWASSFIISYISNNGLYLDSCSSSCNDAEFIYQLVERVKEVCLSSAELIEPTIHLICAILNGEHHSGLVSGLLGILVKYAETAKAKKINENGLTKRQRKEIERGMRECAVIARKHGYKLDRRIYAILNLRNKGGPEKEIQVLKER